MGLHCETCYYVWARVPLLIYSPSNLYSGQNDLQQTVLTWLASETTESFSSDIAPLITQLSSINNADFPTDSDFLGYMSLGSEAFSSNTNVTFYVPTLSIDIQA
jgi:hypothetical protein